jgi:phospholipase C
MKRNSSGLQKALHLILASSLVVTALPRLTVAAGKDRDRDGDDDRDRHRNTPIHHVIVMIGENHTFDNVFGGYKPRPGQKVWNLLSQQIINADGTPGPNVGLATQNKALDMNPNPYSNTPTFDAPYAHIDQPNTTYALGVPLNVPDTRFPPNAKFPLPLPNAPFQISTYTAYAGAFTGDPVHRFFQMWQQVDGGKNDLFQWVAETVGIGPQNSPPAPTPANTFQGGVAMGFNNMSQGDAPFLKNMADNYAISDNYHQGIMGGTGANFIYLGTGDLAFFSDGNGNALVPFLNQIENPDPSAAGNNFYTQDGYGGGSYVNCADMPYQGGVPAIRNFLMSVPHSPKPNCDAGHYYLVNNYSPGFKPDGTPNPPLSGSDFRVPPQTLPNIAESLSNHGVSWKYYIGGWNGGTPTSSWCSICNPFEFITSIMTTSLRDNFADVPDLFEDIEHDTLPAVSFVRPYEIYAGHPANSSLSFYEDFVTHLSNDVIRHHELFRETAILLTMDEGGGYYDSGYIQPLDFFGDGTRIPLIAISPYAKRGYIDHTYYDHGSILKFIEAVWHLSPLSGRSRDHLPNPTTAPGNPYVPTNGPAIGDLMNLFDFDHPRFDAPQIRPDSD